MPQSPPDPNAIAKQFGAVPLDIESHVLEEARKQGVDEHLARAVAKNESGFKPGQTSSAGAQGVMQLMPDTAKGLGVADPNDPLQNIEGGVRYLKQLEQQFPGDYAKQAQAYHQGPSAVAKGVPPGPATTSYVAKVMKDRAAFVGATGGPPDPAATAKQFGATPQEQPAPPMQTQPAPGGQTSFMKPPDTTRDANAAIRQSVGSTQATRYQLPEQVAKAPVPPELQGGPRPNTSLSNLGDYGESARANIQAGYAGMSNPDPERKAHAIHQMVEGGGRLALPYVAPALAASVPMTVASGVLGAGAKAGFDALPWNMGQGYKELGGDTAALVAGAIPAGLSAASGLPGKFVRYGISKIPYIGKPIAAWADATIAEKAAAEAAALKQAKIDAAAAAKATPAATTTTPKPASTPRPTAPPKPLSPKDAAAKALADAQAQITSGTSTTGAGTSLPTPTAPPIGQPASGPPAQGTPFVRTINAPTPAPVQPVPGRQLPTAAQTFPNTPPAPPPMGGPQGGTIPLEPPPPPAYMQPTAAQQFPNTPPAPPVGPAPGATPVAPAFNMQGMPELPPGPTQGTSAYGGKPLPGTEIYGHTNKSPRASTAVPAEAEAAAEAEIKPEVVEKPPAATKPDVKAAAEALAEEVAPGGKAGEVRTIPAGESNFSPEEAKKVNSLLKTMRGKGMTPDTFKTMNPDQQSAYLKGIEEGMAHHGPKIVKAVLDKLRGEAHGGITIPAPPKMARGGMVVPEEPTDWTKLKFNRIFSADTTTQAAKRLSTDTGAPIAKRTRQLSADNRTFLNFVRTELDTHDPQEKVAWVLPDANASVLSQWVAGGARNNLALGKAKAHTSGVQRLSKINGRVALDSGSGPGIYIVRSQS